MSFGEAREATEKAETPGGGSYNPRRLKLRPQEGEAETPGGEAEILEGVWIVVEL